MEDVLISSLKNSLEYTNMIESLSKKEGNIQINGLLPASKVNIAYSIYKNTSRQMLYVANTEYEAKKIYEELSVYMKSKVELVQMNSFFIV